MNYHSLSIYCDLPAEKALTVTPADVTHYLEFLYRVARTGGHTTEEEVFVENLATLLGVDNGLLQGALQESRDPNEGIKLAAGHLKETALRECAYLHACHLTRLDREVSAEEEAALLQAKEGLGLSDETVSRARKLAERHDALLHTFCQLASSPDPADLWAIYLQEGIRHSDRRRKKILPDPVAETEQDERIATLALILKLSGIAWRNAADTLLIQNLSDYLKMSEDQQQEAFRRAWSMDASLGSLALEIKNADLRLVTLSDAHSVCKSDTSLNAQERDLLRELIQRFGIPSKMTSEIIALSEEEAAFREIVGFKEATHNAIAK